jgi:hypothetical protein
MYLQAVEILHFVQDDTKKQFCKSLNRYKPNAEGGMRCAFPPYGY